MSKKSENHNHEKISRIVQEGIEQANVGTIETRRERTVGMKYYLGEPFGDEKERFSKYIDTVVADYVDLLLPDMARALTSDSPAKFSAVNKADVDQAKLETDTVNYVFMEQNDGFMLTHDLLKNSLIQKMGTGKIWWQEEEESEEFKLEGVTEEEIEIAKGQYGEAIEEIEREEIQSDAINQDEMGDLVRSQALYNVTLKATRKVGQVKVEIIPPEEFFYSQYSKGLGKNDSNFLCHSTYKRIEQIKGMDFDFDDWDSLYSESQRGGLYGTEVWEERQARYQDTSIDTAISETETDDDSGRKVQLDEAYFWLKDDKTGEAKYMQAFCVGHTVLQCEEVDDNLFFSISPIRIPHRLGGISIADRTCDLQRIKSVLLRTVLNNIYKLGTGRDEVDYQNINMEDYINNEQGGFIRSKRVGSIVPLPVNQLPGHTFPLIEYLSQATDSRTGASKASRQLDPAVLKNTTAEAFTKAMSMSKGKTELMVRLAADGMMECFRKIRELLRKHQDTPMEVKIGEEWQTVKPSDWPMRKHAKVSVGLGNTDHDEELISLERIGGHMSTLRTDPETRDMVGKEEIYNLGKDILAAMGKKNVGDYIKDPKTLQPAQPEQDPSAQLEQAKIKIEEAKLYNEQKKLEVESEKLELERIKVATDERAKMAEQETKRMELQLKQEEIELKNLELQHEAMTGDNLTAS